MSLTRLEVTERENVLVVDSRLIAARLGIEHHTLLKTLSKYLNRIESRFGVVRFEVDKPLEGSQGGRPEKYALLTEPQATTLMTFSKNTEQVVDCKLELVEAFEKAKQIIKNVIPVQSDRIREMEMEIELLRAKQRYQDTGYSIQLSTSPSVLAWLRGDAPPPLPSIEYRDRFVDPATGREVGASTGMSLKQLVRDAGLNPESTRDRNKVKLILKSIGFDYDKGQGWSTTSYLRTHLALENEVYPAVLTRVITNLNDTGEQNLFVYQLSQDNKNLLS